MDGRKYLFAEQATIHDVVANQKKEIRRVLEELPGKTVLARALDDLVAEMVEKCRLDVPVIDRDGITQLPNEEIDIDISRDPGRYFRDAGPHYIKGTAVKIAVPFKGEAVLFNYGISPWNDPIPGEVVEEAVLLTYMAEKPDPAAAKRELENQIGRIESMLEMVRGPAEEWNRQLPELVRNRLELRRTKLEQDQTFSLGYPPAPAKAMPSANIDKVARAMPLQHDLFLSHASEDKDVIARPLYDALVAKGVSVWFDEAVLELGDSLRRKIDEGLAKCRYGVVILSPTFLAKQWPQRELDGLVARETISGEKAILPIWHELNRDTLLGYSPPLADRLAARSEEGIPVLVEKILKVLRK